MTSRTQICSHFQCLVFAGTSSCQKIPVARKYLVFLLFAPIGWPPSRDHILLMAQKTYNGWWHSAGIWGEQQFFISG